MRDKLHELEEMAAQMFSDRPQPSAEPDLSQRSSFDQDIAKQDPCPFDTVMKVLRALNIRIVAQPVAGGGGLKKGK